MQIVIEIDKHMYENAKNDLLCGAGIIVNAIKNGTREASTQEVSLQFLPKGKYTMTIFADGEQSDKFAISKREVSRSTKLSLPCLQQGGFLLTIEAIEH